MGWSGFSKKCFIKAQKYNCIKILERGSSHIKYQKEILLNEYNNLGIKPNVPSQKMIEKEMDEYNLADFICVPSEYVKESFIKYGIAEDKIIKNTSQLYFYSRQSRSIPIGKIMDSRKTKPRRYVSR